MSTDERFYVDDTGDRLRKIERALDEVAANTYAQLGAVAEQLGQLADRVKAIERRYETLRTPLA